MAFGLNEGEGGCDDVGLEFGLDGADMAGLNKHGDVGGGRGDSEFDEGDEDKDDGLEPRETAESNTGSEPMGVRYRTRKRIKGLVTKGGPITKKMASKLDHDKRTHKPRKKTMKKAMKPSARRR